MAKRKKHLRARERSRQQAKKGNKLRYYPTMYCMGENLYIGVSSVPMKFKGDRWGNINPKYKVEDRHWQVWNCSFREKKYIIDMTRLSIGRKVICPHCGSSVDFRLFGSNSTPRLVDINVTKEVNPNECPET